MEIMFLICAILFFGIIIGLCLNLFWVAIGLLIYFIPTVIATYKKHPNSMWIFILNLIFGWSVIGWLAALLWAFGFDKTLAEFYEFQKAKNAKDAVIENEVVQEKDKDNN